jgi:predicted ATPase
MAIDVDLVRGVFTAQRYKRTRDTVKLDEYQAPTTGQFLYMYKERDMSSSVQVVIHPGLKLEPYLALPGVICPKPNQFRHGSNMREFPKRKHRGGNETPYGRALEINSLESLGSFLQFFDTPSGSEREGSDLPPRLTAIELENFKGVGDRVRIDLAPITLLFGANSAGKSTILQALQYVREILERRNANPDRTLYGGEFIDLGGFRNLVHQRDLSRRIGIKLELDLNRASLPELVPEPFEDWQAWQTEDEEGLWDFYKLSQETRERCDSVSVQLEMAWSGIRQAAVIVGYEAGINGDWLARITATGDGMDVSIKLNKDNPIFVRYHTQDELDVFDALDDWVDKNDLGEELQSDSVGPPAVEDEPDYSYSVLGSILSSVRSAGVEKPGQGLRQWLVGFDSALPHLGELLSIPSGGSGGSANIYIARQFTAFISSLVIGPGVLIRDQLRKLRYLGPIRNVPERDFEAALTPNEARWADGTAAWEALLNGNDALVDEVSRWMADEDKLATGYEVARRKFKEIDVGTLNWLMRAADPDASVRPEPQLLRQVEAAPEKHRIELLDPESGDPFQPRDVGIGISQVLPVVVAALEPSAALVAIEQPELHIHPAVQVGLGDLFIKGAKEHGINFLVETHSEHLILRLLRRIRETTENEVPPGAIGIDPADVAVIYVQSTESGVELVPLPIDETGEFTTRWPKGFFDERAEELF